MSNPQYVSAAVCYALLALRQPRTLAELSASAASRTFPSAAPPQLTFAALRSRATAITPSVDGESARHRGVADPLLVRLNAPELRSVDAA